jgi:hypothetical protein
MQKQHILLIQERIEYENISDNYVYKYSNVELITIIPIAKLE